MQITEKLRTEIALSLPSIGLGEVNKIASRCKCSIDTVYREWRKIKNSTGTSDLDNPVVMALAELAIKRKRETKKTAERMSKITRQLSVA